MDEIGQPVLFSLSAFLVAPDGYSGAGDLISNNGCLLSSSTTTKQTRSHIRVKKINNSLTHQVALRKGSFLVRWITTILSAI
eukprot:scaffold75976_cov44-Attheya_sp.AAC.4